MARTGYKVTVYLDDNPDSPTYGQTYEERVYDTEHCPIEEDDLVLVGNECEIDMSGYTGYRLMTYYNRTTGEYTSVREEDPECEPSSTEEQWVNSGSPFCETTEQGLNTGYMLQLQVQMNQALPSYGTTRYSRYKSPDCALNSCASWDDIQSQCHISVSNCVATFDGTEDVTQIDVNPLSETYNTTRTINREDTGDCQNCTETTFSWVEVGEMCGDNEILCAEGITENPTSKYLVERKYKTIGSSEPVAIGEYRLTLVAEDVEDCGYIPPQYKWEVAQGQFLCDYETYTKYQMEVRWVSYDSGVTWSVDADTEPRRGAVIAQESYDCGKPMYRWVPTDEYVCVDNGDDWKLKITRSTGDPFVVECNDSSELTQDEVSGIPSYTDATLIDFGDCTDVINCYLPQSMGSYSNIAEIQFGNYVEVIGDQTQDKRIVKGYTLIRNNTFKDRVRRINKYAFSGGTRYENYELHLPASIEFLGDRAFYQSTNDGYRLNAVFVNNLTPPDLEYNGRPFGAGVKAIFVPRGYVDLYKEHGNSTSGWTYYSSVIYSLGEEDMCFRPTFTGGVNGYPISPEGVGTELTSGITSIGYSGLSTSSITGVYISMHFTSIAMIAFMDFKSLTGITIPDSITSIGTQAFYNCSGLTSVTIGSGITSIGNNAFWRCSSLREITITASAPPILGMSAFNATALENIYVPSASVEAYKAANMWSNYASIIRAIPNQ